LTCSAAGLVIKQQATLSLSFHHDPVSFFSNTTLPAIPGGHVVQSCVCVYALFFNLCFLLALAPICKFLFQS
jgi:hypothetical protein